MKKLSILILSISLLTVLSIIDIQAQSVKIGLKGGLNLNRQISSLSSINLSTSYGYNLGIFSKIKLSAFFVQPELIYSTEGSSYEIPRSNGFIGGEFKNGYLKLPILAGFQLLKFNAVAGPSFGFLLQDSYDFGTISDNGSTRQEFNSTDIGITVGLGFDITKKLSIATRYNYGFSNVNKDSSDTLKNSTFHFQIEYALFKLGL